MALTFSSAEQSLLLEPVAVTIRAVRPQDRRVVELWTNLPSLAAPEVAAGAAGPAGLAWHAETAVALRVPSSVASGGDAHGGPAGDGGSASEFKVVTIPVAIGRYEYTARSLAVDDPSDICWAGAFGANAVVSVVDPHRTQAGGGAAQPTGQPATAAGSPAAGDCGPPIRAALAPFFPRMWRLALRRLARCRSSGESDALACYTLALLGCELRLRGERPSTVAALLDMCLRLSVPYTGWFVSRSPLTRLLRRWLGDAGSQRAAALLWGAPPPGLHQGLYGVHTERSIAAHDAALAGAVAAAARAGLSQHDDQVPLVMAAGGAQPLAAGPASATPARAGTPAEGGGLFAAFSTPSSSAEATDGEAALRGRCGIAAHPNDPGPWSCGAGAMLHGLLVSVPVAFGGQCKHSLAGLAVVGDASHGPAGSGGPFGHVYAGSSSAHGQGGSARGSMVGLQGSAAYASPQQLHRAAVSGFFGSPGANASLLGLSSLGGSGTAEVYGPPRSQRYILDAEVQAAVLHRREVQADTRQLEAEAAAEAAAGAPDADADGRLDLSAAPGAVFAPGRRTGNRVGSSVSVGSGSGSALSHAGSSAHWSSAAGNSMRAGSGGRGAWLAGGGGAPAGAVPSGVSACDSGQLFSPSHTDGSVMSVPSSATSDLTPGLGAASAQLPAIGAPASLGERPGLHLIAPAGSPQEAAAASRAQPLQGARRRPQQRLQQRPHTLPQPHQQAGAQEWLLPGPAALQAWLQGVGADVTTATAAADASARGFVLQLGPEAEGQAAPLPLRLAGTGQDASAEAAGSSSGRATRTSIDSGSGDATASPLPEGLTASQRWGSGGSPGECSPVPASSASAPSSAHATPTGAQRSHHIVLPYGSGGAALPPRHLPLSPGSASVRAFLVAGSGAAGGGHAPQAGSVAGSSRAAGGDRDSVLTGPEQEGPAAAAAAALKRLVFAQRAVSALLELSLYPADAPIGQPGAGAGGSKAGAAQAAAAAAVPAVVSAGGAGGLAPAFDATLLELLLGIVRCGGWQLASGQLLDTVIFFMQVPLELATRTWLQQVLAALYMPQSATSFLPVLVGPAAAGLLLTAGGEGSHAAGVLTDGRSASGSGSGSGGARGGPRLQRSGSIGASSVAESAVGGAPAAPFGGVGSGIALSRVRAGSDGGSGGAGRLRLSGGASSISSSSSLLGLYAARPFGTLAAQLMAPLPPTLRASAAARMQPQGIAARRSRGGAGSGTDSGDHSPMGGAGSISDSASGVGSAPRLPRTQRPPPHHSHGQLQASPSRHGSAAGHGFAPSAASVGPGSALVFGTSASAAPLESATSSSAGGGAGVGAGLRSAPLVSDAMLAAAMDCLNAAAAARGELVQAQATALRTAARAKAAAGAPLALGATPSKGAQGGGEAGDAEREADEPSHHGRALSGDSGVGLPVEGEREGGSGPSHAASSDAETSSSEEGPYGSGRPGSRLGLGASRSRSGRRHPQLQRRLHGLVAADAAAAAGSSGSHAGGAAAAASPSPDPLHLARTSLLCSAARRAVVLAVASALQRRIRLTSLQVQRVVAREQEIPALLTSASLAPAPASPAAAAAAGGSDTPRHGSSSSSGGSDAESGRQHGEGRQGKEGSKGQAGGVPDVDGGDGSSAAGGRQGTPSGRGSAARPAAQATGMLPSAARRAAAAAAAVAAAAGASQPAQSSTGGGDVSAWTGTDAASPTPSADTSSSGSSSSSSGGGVVYAHVGTAQAGQGADAAPAGGPARASGSGIGSPEQVGLHASATPPPGSSGQLHSGASFFTTPPRDSAAAGAASPALPPSAPSPAYAYPYASGGSGSSAAGGRIAPGSVSPRPSDAADSAARTREAVRSAVATGSLSVSYAALAPLPLSDPILGDALPVPRVHSAAALATLAVAACGSLQALIEPPEEQEGGAGTAAFEIASAAATAAGAGAFDESMPGEQIVLQAASASVVEGAGEGTHAALVKLQLPAALQGEPPVGVAGSEEQPADSTPPASPPLSDPAYSGGALPKLSGAVDSAGPASQPPQSQLALHRGQAGPVPLSAAAAASRSMFAAFAQLIAARAIGSSVPASVGFSSSPASGSGGAGAALTPHSGGGASVGAVPQLGLLRDLLAFVVSVIKEHSAEAYGYGREAEAAAYATRREAWRQEWLIRNRERLVAVADYRTALLKRRLHVLQRHQAALSVFLEQAAALLGAGEQAQAAAASATVAVGGSTVSGAGASPAPAAASFPPARTALEQSPKPSLPSTGTAAVAAVAALQHSASLLSLPGAAYPVGCGSSPEASPPRTSEGAAQTGAPAPGPDAHGPLPASPPNGTPSQPGHSAPASARSAVSLPPSGALHAAGSVFSSALPSPTHSQQQQQQQQTEPAASSNMGASAAPVPASAFDAPRSSAGGHPHGHGQHTVVRALYANLQGRHAGGASDSQQHPHAAGSLSARDAEQISPGTAAGIGVGPGVGTQRGGFGGSQGGTALRPGHGSTGATPALLPCPDSPQVGMRVATPGHTPILPGSPSTALLGAALLPIGAMSPPRLEPQMRQRTGDAGNGTASARGPASGAGDRQRRHRQHPGSTAASAGSAATSVSLLSVGSGSLDSAGDSTPGSSEGGTGRDAAVADAGGAAAAPAALTGAGPGIGVPPTAPGAPAGLGLGLDLEWSSIAPEAAEEGAGGDARSGIRGAGRAAVPRTASRPGSGAAAAEPRSLSRRLPLAASSSDRGEGQGGEAAAPDRGRTGSDASASSSASAASSATADAAAAAAAAGGAVLTLQAPPHAAAEQLPLRIAAAHHTALPAASGGSSSGSCSGPTPQCTPVVDLNAVSVVSPMAIRPRAATGSALVSPAASPKSLTPSVGAPHGQTPSGSGLRGHRIAASSAPLGSGAAGPGLALLPVAVPAAGGPLSSTHSGGGGQQGLGVIPPAGGSFGSPSVGPHEAPASSSVAGGVPATPSVGSATHSSAAAAAAAAGGLGRFALGGVALQPFSAAAAAPGAAGVIAASASAQAGGAPASVSTSPAAVVAAARARFTAAAAVASAYSSDSSGSFSAGPGYASRHPSEGSAQSRTQSFGAGAPAAARTSGASQEADGATVSSAHVKVTPQQQQQQLHHTHGAQGAVQAVDAGPTADEGAGLGHAAAASAERARNQVAAKRALGLGASKGAAKTQQLLGKAGAVAAQQAAAGSAHSAVPPLQALLEQWAAEVAAIEAAAAPADAAGATAQLPGAPAESSDAPAAAAAAAAPASSALASLRSLLPQLRDTEASLTAAIHLLHTRVAALEGELEMKLRMLPRLVPPVPPQVLPPRVGPARLVAALAAAVVRLAPATCGEWDTVMRAAHVACGSDEGVARYISGRVLDSWPRSDSDKEKACLGLLTSSVAFWLPPPPTVQQLMAQAAEHAAQESAGHPAAHSAGDQCASAAASDTSMRRPGGSVLEVDGAEAGVVPPPASALIPRVCARVALAIGSRHTAIANEAVMACLPRSMSSSKGITKQSAVGQCLLNDPAALLHVARALEANVGVFRPAIDATATSLMGPDSLATALQLRRLLRRRERKRALRTRKRARVQRGSIGDLRAAVRRGSLAGSAGLPSGQEGTGRSYSVTRIRPTSGGLAVAPHAATAAAAASGDSVFRGARRGSVGAALPDGTTAAALLGASTATGLPGGHAGAPPSGSAAHRTALGRSVSARRAADTGRGAGYSLAQHTGPEGLRAPPADPTAREDTGAAGPAEALPRPFGRPRSASDSSGGSADSASSTVSGSSEASSSSTSWSEGGLSFASLMGLEATAEDSSEEGEEGGVSDGAPASAFCGYDEEEEEDEEGVEDGKDGDEEGGAGRRRRRSRQRYRAGFDEEEDEEEEEGAGAYVADGAAVRRRRAAAAAAREGGVPQVGRPGRDYPLTGASSGSDFRQAAPAGVLTAPFAGEDGSARRPSPSLLSPATRNAVISGGRRRRELPAGEVPVAGAYPSSGEGAEGLGTGAQGAGRSPYYSPRHQRRGSRRSGAGSGHAHTHAGSDSPSSEEGEDEAEEALLQRALRGQLLPSRLRDEQVGQPEGGATGGMRPDYPPLARYAGRRGGEGTRQDRSERVGGNGRPAAGGPTRRSSRPLPSITLAGGPHGYPLPAAAGAAASEAAQGARHHTGRASQRSHRAAAAAHALSLGLFGDDTPRTRHVSLRGLTAAASASPAAGYSTSGPDGFASRWLPHSQLQQQQRGPAERRDVTDAGSGDGRLASLRLMRGIPHSGSTLASLGSGSAFASAGSTPYGVSTDSADASPEGAADSNGNGGAAGSGAQRSEASARQRRLVRHLIAASLTLTDGVIACIEAHNNEVGQATALALQVRARLAAQAAEEEKRAREAAAAAGAAADDGTRQSGLHVSALPRRRLASHGASASWPPEHTVVASPTLATGVSRDLMHGLHHQTAAPCGSQTDRSASPTRRRSAGSTARSAPAGAASDASVLARGGGEVAMSGTVLSGPLPTAPKALSPLPDAAEERGGVLGPAPAPGASAAFATPPRLAGGDGGAAAEGRGAGVASPPGGVAGNPAPRTPEQPQPQQRRAVSPFVLKRKLTPLHHQVALMQQAATRSSPRPAAPPSPATAPFADGCREGPCDDSPAPGAAAAALAGTAASYPSPAPDPVLGAVTVFIPRPEHALAYGLHAAAIRLPGPPSRGGGSSSSGGGAGGSAAGGAGVTASYRGPGHWSNTVRYNSMVVLQQLDKALKERLAELAADAATASLTGYDIRDLAGRLLLQRQKDHGRVLQRIAKGQAPAVAYARVAAARIGRQLTHARAARAARAKAQRQREKELRDARQAAQEQVQAAAAVGTSGALPAASQEQARVTAGAASGVGALAYLAGPLTPPHGASALSASAAGAVAEMPLPSASLPEGGSHALAAPFTASPLVRPLAAVPCGAASGSEVPRDERGSGWVRGVMRSRGSASSLEYSVGSSSSSSGSGSSSGDGQSQAPPPAEDHASPQQPAAHSAGAVQPPAGLGQLRRRASSRSLRAAEALQRIMSTGSLDGADANADADE